MYRVIKVLNNNAILALEDKSKKELILLGSGIGFGKRVGEWFEEIKDAKVYSLVNRRKEVPTLNVINGIKPTYLEATGKIIEEAEKVFDTVNHDVLLPLADHIAMAAKRAEKGEVIQNPFLPDLRVLFGQEYAVALEGRQIIKRMTGYEIPDSEVGFITLHIHSALSDEKVSEVLSATKIVNESISIIQNSLGIVLNQEDMSTNRLMSHLYYMVIRVKRQDLLNIDLDEYIKEKYKKAYMVAKQVCDYMAEQIKQEIPKEEISFLGIHIQRVRK